MTPQERGLIDDVLADPDGTGPLSVYADWLEDQGTVSAREMAYACRWMLRRNIRPQFLPCPQGKSWRWWRGSARGRKDELPATLFAKLNKTDAWFADYPTWRSAVGALAKGLAALKRLTD